MPLKVKRRRPRRQQTAWRSEIEAADDPEAHLLVLVEGGAACACARCGRYSKARWKWRLTNSKCTGEVGGNSRAQKVKAQEWVTTIAEYRTTHPSWHPGIPLPQL
eukprot:6021996-Amphidinium_carterae.1